MPVKTKKLKPKAKKSVKARAASSAKARAKKPKARTNKQKELQAKSTLASNFAAPPGGHPSPAADSGRVDKEMDDVRAEIRMQIMRLKEIYASARLLLSSRIPNFNEIMD